MKNEKLLPEGMRDYIRDFRWNCGCGQAGLSVSVTKKGTIQAHCFTCGITIFWNDLQLFSFKVPFNYTQEKVYPTPMQKGGLTWWYPKARVRVFKPGQ